MNKLEKAGEALLNPQCPDLCDIPNRDWITPLDFFWSGDYYSICPNGDIIKNPKSNSPKGIEDVLSARKVRPL